MGSKMIKARVFAVRDDINTDLIIPARHLTTMDPAALALHALEDLDPADYPVPFLKDPGRSGFGLIAAGRNFGCGSSREHAPIALAAAGVQAVIAQSFARIFFRNAVNGGLLLPLEAEGYPPDFFATGDKAAVDLEGMFAENAASGKKLKLRPFGPLAAIVEAGGLTAFNRKRMGLAKG